MELATANLQRLSKDVVQDVAQVMKMGAAAEKALNFAKFVDLMMAVEVLHSSQTCTLQKEIISASHSLRPGNLSI